MTATTPARFTVAIPVWNDAEHVGIAIESILAQTYSAWDVIVGDNASTDDIEGAVGRYDDPRVRLHRWADHVGTYENFNRTMALGHNPWVVPLGADDRIVPDGLAVLAAAIAEAEPRSAGRPVAMALSPCRRVHPDGRSADQAYYGSQTLNHAASGTYDAGQWLAIWARPGAPPWNIGSVAFARWALDAEPVAFRPEVGLSADAELMIRIAVRGDVIHYDRPLLEYTVRPGSDGNVRFRDNRRRGDPMTPLGAALLAGFRAHEAAGPVNPEVRRAMRATVARTHLQRAGQHRILEGGRGRRAALADVIRALRLSPRSVLDPRASVYAVGAIVAPSGLIRWASEYLSRRHRVAAA